MILSTVFDNDEISELLNVQIKFFINNVLNFFFSHCVNRSKSITININRLKQ